MEDLFGGKLSKGPLAGILGDYSSNKLLSKSRITKQEREEHEIEQLTEKEKQINKRKKRKRKEMEENDNKNFVIPTKVAKKMKYSNPSSYHKHMKQMQKNNKKQQQNDEDDDDDDDDDDDIEDQAKEFTKSIILGSTEDNHKLLNSLDPTHNDNKNKNNNKSTSNDSQHTDSINNTDANKNDTDSIKLSLTNEQVIARLRELRQPIRYFGETDEDRLKRLRHLEILEHEREEGASKGLKNEFSQSIKNEVEKELEAAMAQSMNQSKKDGLNEYELEMKKAEIKKSKYDAPRNRSSFGRSEDFVLFFFKRMLREWEQSLLNRSEKEKQSSLGKNATMLQKQARRDIRALFKQLKNRTVPSDVLHKGEKMVFAAEKRNYTEAKRIFFEMAIGNAPWPMGVTMVGIHERSGRSKIFSSQIAHVMNDEVQRKYIHAMARLISFCQTKYPNNDPTRNMG